MNWLFSSTKAICAASAPSMAGLMLLRVAPEMALVALICPTSYAGNNHCCTQCTGIPWLLCWQFLRQILQCTGIPWLLCWQCWPEVDSRHASHGCAWYEACSWLLSAWQPKVPPLSPCTLQLRLCKHPLHVARLQQGLLVWLRAKMFQAPAVPLRQRVAFLKMLLWSALPSAVVHEVRSGVQPQ